MKGKKKCTKKKKKKSSAKTQRNAHAHTHTKKPKNFSEIRKKDFSHTEKLLLAVCFCAKKSGGAFVVVVFFKETLHHMTRPGPILRGVQIYLRQKCFLARVRIWVISTVTAPNKHISCKSCSSRTRPSVTATMIA